MSKTSAILSILVLGLGASLFATAGATPQAAKAPGWEYATLATGAKLRLAERLNQMGAQGWELVGEIRNQDIAEIVFKRRLP